MNRAVSNTDSKTLVIGLDGGNLQVFKRLADQGHMPFFASILKQGTSGELRSVVPPLTPPAWSTFMTGKNSGKHGVFDFFNYENSASPFHIVNSTLLRADTIWSMLSRAGKRVGVVNVPMTYPPHPINGVMITGVLTPSIEETFTYPAALYNELRSELGEYIIAVRWEGRRRPSSLIRDLVYCTRQRGKYVRHLMQRDPWDFFMVVFSETDTLQHGLWSYLDPEDKRLADTKIEKLIFNYFGKLDEEIKRICTAAGKNTRVFFISDHGFGPHLNWLYINTWLCQQNWLAFNSRKLFVARSMDKVRRILRRHAFTVRTLYALRQIRLLHLSRKKIAYKFDVLSAIIWERTKAFAVSWGEQGIRINLRGREPNGTVSPGREYEELRDTIIAKLRELRNPDTNEQIIDLVWKKEELYSGPYADRAADIVFSCETLRGLVDVFPHKQFLEAASYDSRGFGNGNHRMDGMFVAYGPGIKAQGTLKSAHLQDLVPTLLYSLRQPIPNDLDGRLLSEIYIPDLLAEYQPEFTAPIDDKLGRSGDYSEEEEQKVLERLRGLGYVD